MTRIGSQNAVGAENIIESQILSSPGASLETNFDKANYIHGRIIGHVSTLLDQSFYFEASLH